MADRAPSQSSAIHGTDASAPLPSTSAPPTSVGRLASLQPLRVVPSEFSARTQMVLALRRIDCVRVEPSADQASTLRFEIQVFYKSPQHHIPLRGGTHDHSRTMRLERTPPRAPDVVVQRSLVALTKLHDDLFQLARGGHGLKPCAFCLSVIEYCGYSRVKPQRIVPWLHSSESASEKLSLYLNELLELVLKVKAFHADHCAGQENIPIVFHRFLSANTRRQSVSSVSTTLPATP